ncbi:MAG TPA: putative sugar O-methyltransferase [Herbaspirillum sp.]|jgi:putative sugar O-methyltransferase
MSNESATAIRILDQMLADLPSQAAIYQPTQFWREASAPIVRELKEAGFDQFRRLTYTRAFFVPTYGPPGGGFTQADLDGLTALIEQSASPGSKKHQSLMHILSGESWALADYRVFLAATAAAATTQNLTGMDLSRFSESATGAPLEQFHFEGRAFSRSALNYLNGLNFLRQELGSEVADIRHVLEIGGGFGTLGEILLQSGEFSYINVDIPPTAAVSSFYLAQQPGIRFADYQQTRELSDIPVPSTPQQMVLCPWQLPNVTGKIDLFVNFISFQEMEPHVVQNYLQHVDRLSARFVLLRNLREGKAVKSEQHKYGVDQPILGSDYDALLPGYELMATNVYPFGYRTVDGFHSELRLYRRRG